MQKIICVCGPTATGKTALAVMLAKIYNAEVVSCDSVQVYKGLDVGSAKVTKEEMQGVPHHLIDVVTPDKSYSCADYAQDAKTVIENIRSRGKTPIFCGGTGLYLDSVIGKKSFSEAGADENFRAEMQGLSPSELHERLQSIDPISADAIHENNVKRVIRALEIFHLTGKTKTEWDALSENAPPQYDAVIIGLDFRSRETLYSRIDMRVDLMMQNGLLDEVKALDCPSFRASTASSAIGYKEILAYFDGLCSLDEAVERIKQASRNYAKRQLTWFRRQKNVNWIFIDDYDGEGKFKLIVNSAVNIIDNN